MCVAKNLLLLRLISPARTQKNRKHTNSSKILKKKKSDEVTLGSRVIITKQGSTDPHDYVIVGSEETNMLERKLSYLSPLGEALMGKKKGSEFTFETPSGKQKYLIISVE